MQSAKIFKIVGYVGDFMRFILLRISSWHNNLFWPRLTDFYFSLSLHSNKTFKALWDTSFSVILTGKRSSFNLSWSDFWT